MLNQQQQCLREWRQMNMPDPIYYASFVSNASKKTCDNDLQIIHPKTLWDISITQLSIQPEETCMGKPLAS